MNEVLKSPEISLVVPTYNEEGNIYKLYEQIVENLIASSIKDYEIIYVDDGSSDASLKHIKELNAKNSKVKFITFSKNFGHQNALRAGLDYAKGNAVICMDADLQHPPELIPTLIKYWEEGNKVVYTKRKDTTDLSFFKKLSSKMFYNLVSYLSEKKL